MAAATAIATPPAVSSGGGREDDEACGGSGGKSAGKSRGFRFSWKWAGELVFDVAFTESVPLGRLRLRGGIFSIDNSSAGSVYGVRCTGISAVDLRKCSRNADKTLIECAEQTNGEPGFVVHVDIPAEKDSTTTVQLTQPVMQVLPQLVMDLVSAGLSAWQHCTFRNDRQQQQQLQQQKQIFSPCKTPVSSPSRRGQAQSQSPGAVRGTRVQVNLLDGVFRITEHWAEPTGHFEFAGSLLIAILAHADGIRIERFDLERGCLRLRSSSQVSPTMICPCLEWILRGEQCCVDDIIRMKRQRTYELRSVVVPPYSIRMSAQDHRAMVRALAELLRMDSEPSEPASELASRDPLALKLVENRLYLTAQVALQGAEVQIMGEEGGHAWPGLKAHTKCPLFEVTVEARLGLAPTINLFAKELEVALWAHNHRLGTWEPVVPACCWEVSYHMQRKPDGGPREVLIRGDVKAKRPVHLVVSAPFVHIASRVFRAGAGDMRYGHLLAALNISGVACRVAVEGGEEGLLAAETHAQPLDWLLKGSGRVGQRSHPCLTLDVADRPGGAPCRVPLGREVCIPWDTGVAGLLVCRLVMPRPPQHLLLVSSTVCVWNRTPSDLEVRFLAPGPAAGETGGRRSGELQPISPAGAFRSVDARCVNPGLGAALMPEEICGNGASSSSRPLSAPPSCGPDGALRLGAGQLLSAPPEAQLRTGQAVLQLRPAPDAAGGIAYQWSDTFFSVPAGTPDGGGMTVCSAPPRAVREALPRHWLHLRASTETPEDGWCTVEVQAPFTLVNACPCDLFCRLNPLVQRAVLGKERERLPLESRAPMELVVSDGRGGEVWVPMGGQAEVLPLRLDAEGCFHWVCNGKPGKTKVKWRNTNCVIAVLDPQRRGEVQWNCIQVSMCQENQQSTPLRIHSQSTLPAFDTVGEDLCLSLALRDEAGLMTSWSLPTQAVASTRSVEETIDLEHRGMYVQLSARRQGRELVVYARWWFANSTGLDVRLLQPWGPGPMHPVPRFGTHVAFLPQVRNDAGDGVANVQLKGHQPVEARVPDINGAEAVQLTALHACCIRTEAVALPESMRGVSSCLVSLLPAILLFNRVGTDVEVGFRQVGCPDSQATWVSSGGSGVLWWKHRPEQSFQVAAREVGASATGTEWSSPFEIKETKIGAYPVALKCRQACPYLLCLCIDQDAATFSVTANGAASCHVISNQHPNLILDACMEDAGDDPTYLVTVPHGERISFAGRTAAAVPRVRLTIRQEANSEERAVIFLDLNRAGHYRAPLQRAPRPGKRSEKPRRSTLRTPAVISVELRDRVALVTVTPGLIYANEEGGENAEESVRTIDGELHLEALSIALITEGPALPAAGAGMGEAPPAACSPRTASAARLRYEAFTVSLAGVSVQVTQTPDRRRGVDFQIRDIQLDMQHPVRDVVLKNITQPFLKTRTLRDDVRMLDMHFRHVELVLGELEVSVTGAAWEQVRLLRRSLAPGVGGLTFQEVLQRANVPYHQGPLEPPQASSKLVVSQLAVSHAKVDVWCRLYLPDAHYVPKTLRDTIQVVSGTNRLEVKGAQVKLPQQTLFSERSPGEGSLAALLAKVSDHYLPHVKACWRSLLQHSNIFLGGLLSRHTWAPRRRCAREPGPPLCGVGPSGEVCFTTSDAA